MEEKTTSAIIITIILIAGIIGVYFMYEATYGKSVEGTKEYLEAFHAREMAQKALDMEIDQADAIVEMYNLLREGKRVCATLVNTRTLAVQQEFVRNTDQAPAVEKMIEVRSARLGATWKLIDVDEMPCKALEEITQILTPKLK